MFDDDEKNLMVSSYSDLQGNFKERVSMTFLGLSMIDLFIVLVFGEVKKEALEKVFSDGSEEDVPGRFFKRPEIARRTLLITDQKV
jgi:6-phosphogluconolactonase/glucosamine-6-phosphate isomerase/deaminase